MLAMDLMSFQIVLKFVSKSDCLKKKLFVKFS